MGAFIVIFALMGLAGFNIAAWYALRSGNEASTPVNQNKLVDGLLFPYTAPQIAGITQWFNSKPLTKDELEGKVVLIDFWTYSCINCIRTLPQLIAWNKEYKDKGLVIIGVHSPEFAFEKQADNVSMAIKKFGITYPVAMDNDFVTWKNFDNHYWPAHYLINKDGKVVYTHFGEGNYGITENNIRFLLGLNQQNDSTAATGLVYESQTPETYLGSARAEREVLSPPLALDQWLLNGKWIRNPQFIEAVQQAELLLHYRAKTVYLVMHTIDNKPRKLTITQDGKTHDIIVKDPQLYEIINNADYSVHELKLSPQPGIQLFAFTFGS